MNIKTEKVAIGWFAVDHDSYDGAPDSVAPANFVGHGQTECSSIQDLLDQLVEHHDTPKRKRLHVLKNKWTEGDSYPKKGRDLITEYLPQNYEVVGETREFYIVEGTDNYGWTAEAYVIPRLASALISAKLI